MPNHPTLPPPGQHQDSGSAPLESDADLPGGVPGKAAPLLDMGVLRDMERDFSDPGVVQRFARDFSVSVPEKIDRLDRGIRAGDLAGAVDAISGVATSAVMVGATRLSQAALATQRLIAAEGLEAAGRSVALLRVCAADTVAELQGAYPTNP